MSKSLCEIISTKTVTVQFAADPKYSKSSFNYDKLVLRKLFQTKRKQATQQSPVCDGVHHNYHVRQDSCFYSWIFCRAFQEERRWQWSSGHAADILVSQPLILEETESLIGACAVRCRPWHERLNRYGRLGGNNSLLNKKLRKLSCEIKSLDLKTSEK